MLGSVLFSGGSFGTFEAKTEGTIPDGIIKEYSTSNEVKRELSFRNGKLNGAYRVYNDSSILSSECFYKDNKPTKVTQYYPSKQIEMQMAISSNSIVVKAYYEDGALKAEDHAISISAGLYHTTEKLFFENGGIKEIHSFKEAMGKEVSDGKEKDFNQNGEIVKITNYKNGIPEYANDAVQISSASLTSSPGAAYVNLSLTYTNLTRKTISGVYTKVQIFTPFREKVFEQTYDEEIVIEPDHWVQKSKTIESSSALYQMQTNDPGTLYALAQNGTAKIKAEVLKVAFDDGTIIEAKRGDSYKVR